MVEIFNKIRSGTALHWTRVSRFKPQIRLSFTLGHYLVRTADTVQELRECFKLRNEVFNKEFCGVDRGYDIDRFDSRFDHLVIVDQRSNQIVGTYRLNCLESLKNSYTALEFDLTSILNQPGPHLELGRACIHRSHRTGSVIALLWRGIAEYMKLSQANLLFGCSSVKVDNPRDAALLYQYFVNEGFVKSQFFSKPQKKFLMADFEAWLEYFKKTFTEEHKAEAQKLLPSLLKSYLRLGASIAGEPAYDADFNCIDFLTVLKRESLDASLMKKFKLT